MDVLDLSFKIADDICSADTITTVKEDIKARIKNSDDTKHLNIDGQMLVIGGLIVQVSAIAVQSLAILVQTKANSKDAAVTKLLEQLAARTGDPDVIHEDEIRQIAEAAIRKLES